MAQLPRMDGTPEVMDVATEEVAAEPLVGMMDMVLLTLLGAVSIYYFFIRNTNKKEDNSALKSFTIS